MPVQWDMNRWVQNEDGTYSRRYRDVAAETDEEVSATKAAAELAEELGVDLSAVEGSGAEGRITKSDVEAAAATE